MCGRRRKGLQIDAQVMALIAKYEGEAQYDEEGALVHREPSFHFNNGLNHQAQKDEREVVNK